jgi:hypothetical protein
MQRQFNRCTEIALLNYILYLWSKFQRTKGINTQFRPFSRDNLTPQALIYYSCSKALHNIGNENQARINTRSKVCMSHMPTNLEIETLSLLGHDSIGMKAQH